LRHHPLPAKLAISQGIWCRQGRAAAPKSQLGGAALEAETEPFLSEAAKHDILGGNAKRIFDLDGAISADQLKRRGVIGD
jgi:hypothetical protein